MTPIHTLPRRRFVNSAAAALLFALLSPAAFAQKQPVEKSDKAPPSAPATNAPPAKSTDPVARIRDEGLNHSQVMQTLSYLSDVIGPRLTASPQLKRANEWTRNKLESWGLSNAHLESWGPFGRGWSLKRFSAQIIEPQAIPLIAFPKAWSPGLPEPLNAEVVWLDAKTETDLDKYKGKLSGAIVLAGPPVELLAHWTPQAARMNETNLLALANAPTPGTNAFPGVPSPTIPSQQTPEQRAAAAASAALAARRLPFATKEGAALIVDASRMGDGGTMFLASASVPNTNASGPGAAIVRSQPWATNTPAIPPQMVLAAEHYNRLVRLIQAGEKVKMSVELQVQFHNDDLMAYNTIAEIPGTDLKDEIVMLGAHMDSWHSGTGATDNGCGVAVCMEVMRILQACELKPRRTIRVGLWTGEEQGLLGSKAYVRDHFGTLNTITITNTTDSAKAGKKSAENAGSSDSKEKEAKSEPKSEGKGKAFTPPTRSVQKLTTKPDYDRFAGYFNLDNGSGKIRGVYMQGNDAVRPIFRKWLAPFKDLGADTLTPNLTGGTDHLNFDAIGLPGFQFIQDDIEYFSRTHHSNMDVFDRAQADDLKQASVIMATFVYNAAMRDEKLPRKPAPPR